MKKKILTICLTVVMLCSLLPTVVFAETQTVTIASADDWVDFCDNAATNQNATVEITADFDMGGVQFSEKFTGTINGNNHTVTYGTDACALFADFAGTAYDLVLGDNSEVKISKTVTVGALANEVTGDVTLYNIVNKVGVATATADTYAGGLIGAISGNGITVKLIACQNACTNSTGVQAKKSATVRGGGLIGAVTGSNVELTLTRCANNGKVSTNESQVGSLGGLIGYWEKADGTLKFDRCVNSVDINTDEKGPVAGFLGDGPDETENNTFKVSFFKCANTGAIGGLAILKKDTQILSSAAGFLSGTVANTISFDGCYNTGNISLTYDIRDAYNMGATEINGAGFAADSSVTTEGTFTIKNSYLDADMSGTNGTDKNGNTHTVNFGRFTVTDDDYTADNALDLSNGATLADVAALENGTLFNADGTLVWETSKTLTTVSGAAIRTKTPTGLRFGSSISKSEYEKLCTEYKTVTVGTIIAPAVYIEKAGAFTMEALDELGYAVNYLNVDATDALVEKGDQLIFTGSVVNIKENHYELEYVGRGYLLCVDAEGNKTVIYADYEDSCESRTVYDVATKALADENNGLTPDAVTAIQAIVDKVERAN